MSLLNVRAPQNINNGEAFSREADSRTVLLPNKRQRKGEGTYPCQQKGCSFRFYERIGNANAHMRNVHEIPDGDARMYRKEDGGEF